MTAPTAAGMSYTSGFDVYFAQTMKDFAVDNHTTLIGRYDVSVFCVDSFAGTKFAEFKGSLTFTSPTKYRAAGAASGPTPSSASGSGATAVPGPDSAPGAAGASGSGAAEVSVPAASEPSVPVGETAAAAPPGKDGLPVGWVVGAVAAVMAAFEVGRRFGRRTATR
ncbi:hypothetical protein ACFY36_25385 [Actinoplanes sp. NPDC000266]